MAETDNPEVKEWLKLKSEQKLKRLTGLTINEKNVNNFFESRQIVPTSDLAWYNPTTDKYVLGPHGYFLPNSSFSTAAVAALTLTCATGHKYRVYYASAVNATRASLAVLSGNIGGNAITRLNAVDTPTSTTIFTIIGGTTYAYNDGVETVIRNSLKEVWLYAGDTLTLTLTTFVAGDDTEHLFLFEDYPVA